jgi:uncharacterized membrane protein
MRRSHLSLVERAAPRVDLDRWASLVTGTALVAYGLKRRGVPGMCVALAAAPLALRGISGAWPRLPDALRRSDTLGGDRGVRVHECARLELPVEEVYRFWRRLENLPRFMRHVEVVTDLGDGRSHWIVRGPAGLPLEWDAELINDVENRLIAWKSLPGADVVSAGSVRFSVAREGRSTEVSVHLQYAPPAGKAGAWAAGLFGREPSQTLREDLRRLKQLLEAGEISRARRQA